jgi:hypothetical protein
MVDANCDIEDLMYDTKYMKYMESSIQLMEELFIKYESQEEAHNDNNNSRKSNFHDIKEKVKIHKMIFSRWFSDIGKNCCSTKIDVA